MDKRKRRLLCMLEGSGRKSRWISGAPPLSFKAKKAGELENYRIYGNTVGGESVGNLVTDSHSEHYGKYAIPITNNSKIANIYLNEPLRMVGDETEYVDYETQKWHRVRKNLLQNTTTSRTINGVTFTVNSDGSVTCNGTANDTILYEIHRFPRFSGKCILSGCPINGSDNAFQLQYTNMRNMAYREYGTGVDIYQFDETQYPASRIIIRIANGYTCDNITFYPMIRKADIEDDTYEPYIENTDLDVTLPALPTLPGTNVLSVGTAVQPSEIEVKGKIKAI